MSEGTNYGSLGSGPASNSRRVSYRSSLGTNYGSLGSGPVSNSRRVPYRSTHGDDKISAHPSSGFSTQTSSRLTLRTNPGRHNVQALELYKCWFGHWKVDLDMVVGADGVGRDHGFGNKRKCLVGGGVGLVSFKVVVRKVLWRV